MTIECLVYSSSCSDGGNPIKKVSTPALYQQRQMNIPALKNVSSKKIIAFSHITLYRL